MGNDKPTNNGAVTTKEYIILMLDPIKEGIKAIKDSIESIQNKAQDLSERLVVIEAQIDPDLKDKIDEKIKKGDKDCEEEMDKKLTAFKEQLKSEKETEEKVLAKQLRTTQFIFGAITFIIAVWNHFNKIFNDLPFHKTKLQKKYFLIILTAILKKIVNFKWFLFKDLLKIE